MFGRIALWTASVALAATTAAQATSAKPDSLLERRVVRTLPVDAGIEVRSGTYTPSGKVLLSYQPKGAVAGVRDIRLATMNDDARGFRPFFAERVPDRPKDNGIRFMVFPDNRRVFLGGFLLECRMSLETCRNPQLLPVAYPPEVADGAHIGHRWSEMIVAPDNRHVAWTTLLSNNAAVVLSGDYSDTPEVVYSGSESLKLDPRGNSTYQADMHLSGGRPGRMDLTLTFGPLGGERPARIVFDADASGRPASRGFAEYDGQRLEVGSLAP